MRWLSLTRNRSWAISGVAIRHASALGLNLQNNSKDIPEGSKEIRYRVWWALCSHECILAVMTGRPTSFTETDCTAPPPLPFEEESFLGNNAHSPQDLVLLRHLSSQESQQAESAVSRPPSTGHSSKLKVPPVDPIPPALRERKQVIPPCNALYFKCHAALCTFTNEVLNRLYRASAMSKSWADVQSTIAGLNLKIEKLRAELPTVFDFARKQKDQQFIRQRMSLGFFYYSILTVINRPCLCRLDKEIPDQSQRAHNFNRETAMKCVHAARNMLELLPQEPNAVDLCKIAPWWCLVHYLMQAATVLMLELSFRCNHMPSEAEGVFESAKIAIEWLESLSEEDEAAKRAWSLCDEMLRKVAPKVGKSSAEASKSQAISNHQGHAADQPQGDDTLFAQAPATYLPQHWYTSFSPLQPPMFSYDDQLLSYGQGPAASASGPYNDLFPTASEIGGMQYENQGQAGYFNEQNQQQWYPGGSGEGS